MSMDLDFNKSETALVIIDMQNAFIKKDGSLSRMGLDTSRVSKVIEPIRQLKNAFHSSKMPVIYLKHEHRTDGLDAGLIVKVFPPIMDLGHCKTGTWDSEIIEELKPISDDIIITKYRFSGFYNTLLDTILKEKGIKTLVICGIATNICVESTVRDAFYRDYNVFVPIETTASFFEQAELGSFENFKFAFARVVNQNYIEEKLI